MSATISGAIPGEDPFGRAVALAGLLAEMGVQAAALTDEAGWVELRARETDLPTLLEKAAGAAEAELICLDRPLRFEIRADRIEWFTTEASIADALRHGAV